MRDDHVYTVVKEIAEHAFTGLEGDGILSVLDLGSVVEIRSKEEVTSSLPTRRFSSISKG